MSLNLKRRKRETKRKGKGNLYGPKPHFRPISPLISRDPTPCPRVRHSLLPHGAHRSALAVRAHACVSLTRGAHSPGHSPTLVRSPRLWRMGPTRQPSPRHGRAAHAQLPARHPRVPRAPIPNQAAYMTVGLSRVPSYPLISTN